jgi:hypothetical protein
LDQSEWSITDPARELEMSRLKLRDRAKRGRVHDRKVAVLVQQGLRFMAENVNRTTELLGSMEVEEDYENIVVLEDEIDD